jgi:hypothetical protein
MRRLHLLVTVGVATMLTAQPVVASPAVVLGVVAVSTAIAISATQQEHEAWEYTDKHGWVGGAREHVATVDAPLRSKPGTSRRVVDACRDALQKNAERFDLASLEAVGAGKQVRLKGRIVAPLEVRAIYKVRGVHEVKRSKVRCEVDRAGRVIATS